MSDFSAAPSVQDLLEKECSFKNIELWNSVGKMELLTRSTMKMLVFLRHVVTPKAEGTRKILVCEEPTGRVTLLNERTHEKEILLDNHENCTVKGFAIEVMEVCLTTTGDRHFLAFNILALNKDLSERFPFQTMPEMVQTLESLVRKVSVPHLSVKHFWCASKAEHVWELANKLPYPVDGLIFSPYNLKFHHESYKWKPVDRLLMYVRLGGPTETNSDGSIFVPHLHSRKSPKFSVLRKLIEEVEFGKKPISETSFFTNGQCILTWCRPFHINEKKQTQGQKGGWHVESCPEDSLKSDELTNDQVKQADEKVVVGMQEEAHTLFVPHPYNELAHHRVVKVQFDPREPGKLLFKSLQLCRFEDSIEVAQKILDLISHPLHLNELSFPKELNIANTSTPNGLRGILKHVSKKRKIALDTTFPANNLHRLLNAVNGLLYSVFGGSRIVDTCCDLVDTFRIWNESGCRSVTLVNINPILDAPALTQESLATFKAEKSARKIEVDIINLDTVTSINEFSPDAAFYDSAANAVVQSKDVLEKIVKNVVPVLKEGGNFVVTYMGDDNTLVGNANNKESAFQRCNPLASDGPLNNSEEKQCSFHSEYLISLFRCHGLQHITSYSFKILGQMFPTIFDCLTVHEAQSLAFRHAMVFQKTKICSTIPVANNETSDSTSSLILFLNLPESFMLQTVFLFLTISDIAKAREVCKTWWREINEVVDHHEKHKWFFDGKKKSILYFREDEFTNHSASALDPQLYRSNNNATIFLRRFPLISFIRFGGQFKPLPDDSSEEEHDVGEYRVSYDNNSDNYDSSYFPFSHWSFVPSYYYDSDSD